MRAKTCIDVFGVWEEEGEEEEKEEEKEEESRYILSKDWLSSSIQLLSHSYQQGPGLCRLVCRLECMKVGVTMEH